MKTTRILLADNSGVLDQAALRLRRMLPNLSTGACTVRSADACEPLTQWRPDLVLLDPNRDECGGATPDPHAKTRAGASRVLVLSLSYEREARTRRRPRQAAPPRPDGNEPWRLASVTVQAMEMEFPG